MRDQAEGSGNLQSVRRALRALELISEHGELGVTELGRKLDVHKATASRLIATLAERSFVERDPISEKYRLGFGLISLAGAAVGGNDLVRAARPILDELAERTRETVNLGVLSGGVGRLRRPGDRHPLDRERQLGGAAHAAALHVQRQGAAGVRDRRGTRSTAPVPASASSRRARSPT